MDIRTISSKNFIPIIDPAFLKQSPDEFLAENGGFLSEVAIVAKSTSGFVHYRSATAPTDRETNEFFSTFSSIADSIGIKVYAFINGLADSFLAKNHSYSAIKDGGNPNDYFVDPFKSSYINYLKAIITEVLAFPVHGILVDNIKFPREEYSFCESCRRKFSEAFGIERIFSLGDLQNDPNLINQWMEWRSRALEDILKELSSTIASTRVIDFNITMDIDPTIDGSKGAFKQFGQKISMIAKYGIPAIHLSAWTPYPASIDSPEYKTLVKNIQFAKDFQARNQDPLSLFVWGAENENVLNVIDSIKEEIQIKNVFAQTHLPIDYQVLREIHLGLG
ncbi:MAG: hypothetical protein FK730_09055 [Asgard group archaeon]|nr:hypothetical protein [Asgard group archaeon]